MEYIFTVECYFFLIFTGTIFIRQQKYLQTAVNILLYADYILNANYSYKLYE